MKLSFLPGELYLNKEQDGFYVLTLQGEEVLRTPQEKKALTKFNALRREMEAQFPAHELTLEQKRALLSKWVADSKVGLIHNSVRPAKKKIAKSRTYG
jgi:hypothetical protein